MTEITFTKNGKTVRFADVDDATCFRVFGLIAAKRPITYEIADFLDQLASDAFTPRKAKNPEAD
jgi:hypothetical protein